MKKSKILVLSLALALLACALFAFNASAEEDGNVGILSKNVAYSSNVQMIFAVDATLEEADNVVVKYYFESAPETVYIASLNDVNDPTTLYTDKNGAVHPSFSTVGVPAKEYGEKVYVAAQTKGAIDDPVYEVYSVAEYFYEKLFAQGYVFETEGEDFDRRSLYELYLSCGAAAQKVLINNKNPENAEELITDYNYIAFPADISGVKAGFYADGATLDLTLGNYTGALPENMEFDSWKLVKFDSLVAEPTEEILSGSTYALTVDGIYTFVPVFVNALPGGNGTYYNAYKNSTVGGTVYDFAGNTASDIGSTFSSWNGGAYCTVSLLSDAKYLHYEKSSETTTNIQRALTFESDENATELVIEMDMRINGELTGVEFFSVLAVHTMGYSREIYFNCDSDGLIQFRNSNQFESAEGYEGVKRGEWFNVRFEISKDDISGSADVYINGAYACQTSLLGSGTSTNSCVVFHLRSMATVGTSLEIDNVYMGFKN